ncbi:MAG: peptidase domain-containing ABC transporter [Bacteroidetes bacterium]|nr:peptidase domain-containing ABC transporter [Bacteroidota bacterium]
MSFPFYKQLDQMDCGATCLKMIARYYGKSYSVDSLRRYSHITREGVSLLGISDAAERIGFRTVMAKITFDQLNEDAQLPCVLHWNQRHFVVLPPQNYDPARERDKIVIADPAHGVVKLTRAMFLKSWASDHGEAGVVLLLEPTREFYQGEDERKDQSGIWFLFQYLKKYRKFIIQLFLSVLLGSILSLIFPFLTQSLVDYGVNHLDVGFISLMLMAQLMLFVGSTANEMLRSWIMLHMNSRINISILSDFLIKLMKLPIRFFDSKLTGDITQRISDHDRIERFLTNNTLNALFSCVTLVVFSVILGIYSGPILLLFLCGTCLSILWIQFFMRRRKQVDYARFQQMSLNQSNIFELIMGMQEIKLNNCENEKRWKWERVQAKLFGLNIKNLGIEQYQQMGNAFFNQLKNILVTYIAAREVVNGQITLGMMLSISYIIGQLTGPIDQILGFFRSAQDAKISIDRLREIHNQENEEPSDLAGDHSAEILDHLEGWDLILEKVSFQYAGHRSPMVLKDIDLVIPRGKVTAIVGSSGSGKTTLLKLLLGFYKPVGGRIRLGPVDMAEVSPKMWRSKVGAVMQDGFIFSDTIAGNIVIHMEGIDKKRLLHAMDVANIGDFIKTLPLGFNTKIGENGNGISAGQKQRMLIARAVYKDPMYLFFDEATSALDANNERVIIDKLNTYFNGKTVVVIAHRLSTVKHADQIVVLENGRITEVGNHSELTRKQGRYYDLVRNQLELGQ